MGQEIERRFLVNADHWQQLDKPAGKRYMQGYLLNADDCNVRVRVAGEKGYLTVKGMGEGISRLEYEYEIPKEEAEEMIEKFRPQGTEKIRYRIPASNGLTWEVDQFLGANDGLIIAEIELENKMQSFDRPEWLEAEISEDERYANSSLAKYPFSEW